MRRSEADALRSTCVANSDRPRVDTEMPRPKTVRVVEIALLLGVTHQRAGKIVGEAGSLGPLAWMDLVGSGTAETSRPGPRCGDGRSPGARRQSAQSGPTWNRRP